MLQRAIHKRPDILAQLLNRRHMMYIHLPSIEKLRKDVGAFMDGTLQHSSAARSDNE